MELSQTDRLYNLLRDFEWHKNDQIQEVVYGRNHLGVARIAARIHDVKKKYSVEIECEHDSNSLWKYRMKKPLEQRTLFDN